MNQPSPPLQPTRPQANGPASSPGARLVWFVVFTTIGVGALAAGVLLPDCASLAQLEGRRDALAHQVQCESELARYNDRLMQGLENDPVLTARLMIRYANYLPAGYREVGVDPSRLEPAPPERIMNEASRPPAPPQGVLSRAGQWVGRGTTRGGLIVLGLVTLALGLILFAGAPRRRRQPPSPTGQLAHTHQLHRAPPPVAAYWPGQAPTQPRAISPDGVGGAADSSPDGQPRPNRPVIVASGAARPT